MRKENNTGKAAVSTYKKRKALGKYVKGIT
jgi:hypothetical protein